MVFKPFFKFKEQVHIADSEILFFATLKGETQLAAAPHRLAAVKVPQFMF